MEVLGPTDRARRRPNVSCLSITFIGLPLTLFLLNCTTIGWDGFTTSKSRAASRSEVRELFNRLQVGDTWPRVHELLKEQSSIELIQSDKNGAIARIPLETLATAWTIHLEFQDGEHLSGAIVGTDDNASWVPKDAPEEIGDFKAW